MSLENSEIRLTAYTGKHSPMYFIDGFVRKGKIEASVKDDNKEVARVRGEILNSGYFYFIIEFNYCEYYSMDLFGSTANGLSISECKLGNEDQAFFASGIVGEHVVADFSFMNLDGVVNFLITGEIK